MRWILIFMKVKPKNKFVFGKGSCRFYLRKTYSNIFVTMTDLKGNVIKCTTSGSAGVGKSKRRKKAPQSFENIVLTLKSSLQLYKVNKIFLYLSCRVSRLVYSLIKEIQYHGFVIRGVVLRHRVAHNGVKGRKLRRV